MVADRHAVADRHLVVRIGPGVHLLALADIAPGDEIAGIDEADQRARFAGRILDICLGPQDVCGCHVHPSQIGRWRDSIVRYDCATQRWHRASSLAKHCAKS